MTSRSKRWISSSLILLLLSPGLLYAPDVSADSGYIPNADIKQDPLMNKKGVEGKPGNAQTVSQASFQIDESTGSAIYQYPLQIPQGRKNLTPNLSLTYNSGNKNTSSLIGYGWDLTQAYIVRSDHLGTNHLYDGTDEFQLNLFGESGELIGLELDDGVHGLYGKKFEDSFHRYRYESSNYWTVTSQNGTSYTFGKTAETQQVDPQNSGHIYKWFLEEIQDPNGNTIHFDYFKDENQLYPETIHYTGHESSSGSEEWPFTLTFSYEDRTDKMVNYRPGFRVVTKKRLHEVKATIEGSDGERSWTLGYQNGNNDNRSLLESITEHAINEASEAIDLPPTKFTYNTAEIAWEETELYDYPIPVEFVSGFGGDNGNRLVDVDGDGYVDIVASTIHNEEEEMPESCDQSGISCPTEENPTTYINTHENLWEEKPNWDSGVTFANNEVSLMDLNGDLLPEIYRPPYSKDGNPSREGYLINGGDGWADEYQFDDNTGNEYAVTDEGMRMVDVNGDGFDDQVTNVGSTYNQTGGYIKFNTGMFNWEIDESWSLPATTAFTNTYQDSGLRFGDVNSDGLTDIILAVDYDSDNDGDTNTNEIIKKIYLNNGQNGWVEESGWTMPYTFTKIYYSNGAISSSYQECLYDINSDGLTDWKSKATASALSNGVTGWIEDESLPNTLADCGGTSGTSTYVAYRTADINGDGIMDELDTSEQSPDKITLSIKTKTPDLLGQIDLPTGGSIDLNYKLSTEYKDEEGQLLNPKLPFPMTTVYEVIENDGFNETSTTTYTYSEGRYYRYDVFRSEFAGFGKTIKKIDDQKTITLFDQGCASGDSCSSPFYYPGTLLKSSSNDTIWVVDGNYKRAFTSSSAFTNSGFSWYEVQVVDSAVLEGLEEGDVWDSESDTFNYSLDLSHFANKGKPTRIEITDLEGNLFYQKNNLWEVDVLENKRYFSHLFQSLEFEFDGEGNHREKAAEYTYDLQTGQVTETYEWGEVAADPETGEIISEKLGDERKSVSTYTVDHENWIVTLTQNELFDKDGNRVSASKYSYDSRGNLETQGQWLNATNEWITTTYEVSGNEFGLVDRVITPKNTTTEIVYDSWNLYPKIVTNPLGHTQTQTYDLLTGKLKNQTNANGYQYAYTYDGFGRLTSEAVPHPTTGETTVVSTLTYSDTEFPTSWKKSSTIDGITVEAGSSQDGFGRPMQTWTTNENTTFNKVDTSYNEFGSVEKQSLPYSSITLDWEEPTAETPEEEYSYDPLNRLILKTLPKGHLEIQYSVGQKTVIDANENTKNYHNDIYGNLIQVDEINEDEVYITTYTYDPLGNLLSLVDAQNNVRHFTYDSLSRKTTQEDLHAVDETNFGKWIYSYDAHGNLLTQTDPKNQVIQWSYDELDRLSTEDWFNDGTLDIVYTYDTATHGIGLLASIVMETLETHYNYDALGQVFEETKIIEGTSYTTQMTHDLLGRLQQVTYPQNALTLSYTYNPTGQLETAMKNSTDAIITGMDYSAMGTVSSIQYGNGVVTTNTYNSNENNRLVNRTTESPYTNYDADGDGYTSEAIGGDDCDDDNAQVHPGKEDEEKFDNLDSNCDGLDYKSGATILVPDKDGILWEVFKYEASNQNSSAVSRAGTTPWAEIDAYDANQKCAEIGGALISENVWQNACEGEANLNFPYGDSYSAGTCNDSSGSGAIQSTGSYPQCVSSYGAYDLIGNLGETTFNDERNVVWRGGSIYTDSRNTDCQSVWYTEDDFWDGDNHSSSKLGFRCMKGHDLKNTDTDGDGLTDYEELYVHITNPSSPDTDEDHLSDYEEIYTYHTDPLNEDTDGDSWSDGFEIYKSKTDPLTYTEINIEDLPHHETEMEPGESNGQDLNSSSTNTVTSPSSTTNSPQSSSSNTINGTKTEDNSSKFTTTTPSTKTTKRIRRESTENPPTWWDSLKSWIIEKTNAEEGTAMLQNLAYTYDNAGNILTIEDQSITQTAKTMTYTYDDLNRLVTATSSGFSEGDYAQAYSYDSIGNMLTKSDVGTMVYDGTGFPNPHAVTEVEGVHYTYDLNGNLTDDGSQTYEWTIRNELQSSGDLVFSYDQSGQRVKTRVSDGNGNLQTQTIYINPYMEVREDRTIYYLWAGGLRAATLEVLDGQTMEEGQLTYTHQDHLGGTSMATDENGALVQVYDYAPYGSQLLSESYDDREVAHSFTGKELEEDLGLYYFEARYYNPTLGRFVSVDPMQYKGVEKFLENPESLNYYAYAVNNPIIFIDPLGLEATIIIRKDTDGLGLKDFGHTAIEIDGVVYEYYGESNHSRSDYIKGVKGILETDTMDGFINDYYRDGNSDGKDDINEVFFSYTIETTDEENQMMVDYFTNLQKDTPDYKLFSNNCTTIVEDALSHAGVANFRNADGTRPITPSGFHQSLRLKDKQGEINITTGMTFYESLYY